MEKSCFDFITLENDAVALHDATFISDDFALRPVRRRRQRDENSNPSKSPHTRRAKNSQPHTKPTMQMRFKIRMSFHLPNEMTLTDSHSNQNRRRSCVLSSVH